MFYDGLRAQSDQALSIIIMNIDFFKEYNDQFGHSEGDQCLITFSHFLRSLEEDHHVKFFRYGGEEFVGVRWDTKKEEVAKFAEEIRAKTENLNVTRQAFTISVGVAITSGVKSYKIEKLIQDADQALYHAKNTGRNRVEVIILD